jgi:SAM-dependent methyltransferase
LPDLKQLKPFNTTGRKTMAAANEHMQTMIRNTYRQGRIETVRQDQRTAGLADLRRTVRSGLRESLGILPQEQRLDIGAAGRGRNPESAADVVVAGLELIHFGTPGQVAGELLRACRPGGRIGLACAVPGSFLAEIHARIEAYSARDGRGQGRSFTGTRENLDALFGSAAIALGARDRSVPLRYASAGHWFAEWQTSYAPLKEACEQIEPAWRGQFATDLTRIAASFAEVNAGKLSIRCDYLEFIVHKGNIQ